MPNPATEAPVTGAEDRQDDNQRQVDPEAPPRSALGRLAADPVSRRRFVAVGGAGVATGLSAFLAACGGSSSSTSTTSAGATGATTSSMSDAAASQFGEGDLGIVNYALTLEYLEAAFYAAVIKSGLFKGSQLELIKVFGSDEDAHVKALEATAKKLGTPASKPKTQFPLDSADEVLKTAASVENLGAAAYLGQAPNIQSDEILAAALAIHTVEARHASTLNLALGKTITPDGAFAKPASMDEVLPQVQPFIVS